MTATGSATCFSASEHGVEQHGFADRVKLGELNWKIGNSLANASERNREGKFTMQSDYDMYQ